MRRFFAVDLDGTLAHYEHRQRGIGEPIAPMVERVRLWIARGDVPIVWTARVADGDEQVPAITAWCVRHIGAALPVTAVKHRYFSRFYGDTCVRVEPNTGACDDGE